LIDLVPKCISQLQREGFKAARVECRCPAGRKSPPMARDLWNAFDALGISTRPGLLDVGAGTLRVILAQVTSASNMSARRRKVEQHSEGLLHPDVFIEVWGYKGTALHKRQRWTGEEWVTIT
jgi:hypothetical protein